MLIINSRLFSPNNIKRLKEEFVQKKLVKILSFIQNKEKLARKKLFILLLSPLR